MNFWDGYDRIPVRLPGRRRAYLELPRPLSAHDAEIICQWTRLHVEPRVSPREITHAFELEFEHPST